MKKTLLVINRMKEIERIEENILVINRMTQNPRKLCLFSPSFYLFHVFT